VPLDNLQKMKEVVPSSVEEVRFPKSYNALWCVFVQMTWYITNYCDLTEDESRIIWKYRNTENIRKWMKNNQPIAWKDHCDFMKSLKNNETKRYFAFFLGDRFIASYDIIGIHDAEAECGLYLNTEYEGRGLASMVQTEMERYAKETGIQTLRSEVLLNNTASLRFFTRNGFIETKRDSEMVYLEKKL
jgi:UDP-4-amino-4,6-dideoxy-N-acetyl-beta-L-altrosamine N-acetyltransferase